MKVQVPSDKHVAFSFRDDDLSVEVVEWGRLEKHNVDPWVSINVHPSGERRRNGKPRDVRITNLPRVKAVSVEQAILFLSDAEFNTLRKKVIDSMIEDGELIDLSAQAQIDVEIAEAVSA